MPSKYNQEQKKTNLELATKMSDVRFPAVLKNGKPRMVMQKKGLPSKPMESLRYDPAHIKKICKLNKNECHILGIHNPKLEDSVANILHNKARQTFRKATVSLKDRMNKMKQRKSQRIARKAARGS